MSKSPKTSSTIELPNGVKVHCPEDGGAMQSPVTVEFNGSEIVCHDARSLLNTITMTLSTLPQRKQGDGKQGTGPKRLWKEARELTEKRNKGKPESEWVSVDEVRRELAREKKRQKLEAALKIQSAKRKKSA